MPNIFWSDERLGWLSIFGALAYFYMWHRQISLGGKCEGSPESGSAQSKEQSLRKSEQMALLCCWQGLPVRAHLLQRGMRDQRRVLARDFVTPVLTADLGVTPSPVSMWRAWVQCSDAPLLQLFSTAVTQNALSVARPFEKHLSAASPTRVTPRIVKKRGSMMPALVCW